MNENFSEKIGLNVSEAANLLGISKNLMSELIKYPDFPCIKFRRRSCKRRSRKNKISNNRWNNK